MSDKRSQLENAATELVQNAGLNNLSFRTLAAEVGVKSSSVHYYFPEKPDLAAALIEKYSTEMREKLTEIDSRNLTPPKRLDAFVSIFEDVVKAEKFCLCGMMAAEIASLDATSRTLLSQYFQYAEDWLTALFEQSAKQKASKLKPRSLARVVMSGLEGAILLDRVDHNHDRLRAQKELVRHLLS